MKSAGGPTLLVANLCKQHTVAVDFPIVTFGALLTWVLHAMRDSQNKMVRQTISRVVIGEDA